MQDTNDYYDCLYEEGTTRTRDNNSNYGDTGDDWAALKCSPFVILYLFALYTGTIKTLQLFSILILSFFPKTAKLHFVIYRLPIHQFMFRILLNLWKQWSSENRSYTIVATLCFKIIVWVSSVSNFSLKIKSLDLQPNHWAHYPGSGGRNFRVNWGNSLITDSLHIFIVHVKCSITASSKFHFQRCPRHSGPCSWLPSSLDLLYIDLNSCGWLRWGKVTV